MSSESRSDGDQIPSMWTPPRPSVSTRPQPKFGASENQGVRWFLHGSVYGVALWFFALLCLRNNVKLFENSEGWRGPISWDFALARCLILTLAFGLALAPAAYWRLVTGHFEAWIDEQARRKAEDSSLEVDLEFERTRFATNSRYAHSIWLTALGFILVLLLRS